MSNLKLRAKITDYRTAQRVFLALNASTQRERRVQPSIDIKAPRGYAYKIGYETYVCRYPTGGEAPIYTIRHFDTDIVTYYPDGDIRLSCPSYVGDWNSSKPGLTKTTAHRMHLCTPDQIGVGCGKGGTVEIREYKQTVSKYSDEPYMSWVTVETMPFKDGMLITP